MNDESLRRALRSRVAKVGASDEAWLSISRGAEHRARQRRMLRTVVATLAAFALGVGAFVGLQAVFRPSREPQLGRPGRSAIEPHVSAAVRVGSFPQGVTTGEGAVWVTVPAQHPSDPDLIIRLDPSTNRIVAEIPIAQTLSDVAVGEGAVWASRYDKADGRTVFSVLRIDPKTNQVVATIPNVGGHLAVGDGAVWTTARGNEPGTSTLVRIDESTNSVAAEIPLGTGLWHATVEAGSVWVLTLQDSQAEPDLIRVDTQSNRVEARIDLPIRGSVFAPVVGEGVVWVPVVLPDGSSVILRLDTGTSEVLGEPIPIPPALPFAVGAGRVWFLGEGGSTYGLNVQSLEVDESVPDTGTAAGQSIAPTAALDGSTGSIWIANYRRTVTRIDLYR